MEWLGSPLKSAEPAVVTPRNSLISSEDVDFAEAIFRNIEAWPGLEIRITARERPITEEMVTQLIDFISRALTAEQSANGFLLSYDFRKLQNPSVRMLCSIAKWAAEPERKALFTERCVGCKTCVPPGWKFWATKTAMDAFFLICPPTCKTYLTTDFDDDSKAVCFDARKTSEAAESASHNCTSVESSRMQEGPSPSFWQRLFCCRRRSVMSKDQQRIQELERIVRELKEALDATNHRVSLLQSAIPWAAAIEQLQEKHPKRPVAHNTQEG